MNPIRARTIVLACLAFTAAASARDAPARHRDPAEEPEILAERGDVRIVLAGSCGRQSEGREAVLLHRDADDTVAVKVERSRWVDGRFQSSRTDHYTLSGREEKRLGCTRFASHVEQRFALVHASDNSVEGRRPHSRAAAPRDFVALADSGTCGQRGEGRRVVAVNQHPHRSIRVVVERVERLEGKLHRSSRKSYRLPPGGEKELGCNRQGRLQLELSVAEARW